MAQQEKGDTEGSKNFMWDDDLDDAFVQCMIELKEKHQVENGNFSKGAFKEIANMMEAKIPGCGVKGIPNVRSRLKRRKKKFYVAQSLRAVSGFGWNESTQAIDVDDDVFLDYAEKHENCAVLNRTPFPYYDDLADIFGKGRAAGDATAGANEKPLSMAGDEQPISLDDGDENGDEFVRKVINEGVEARIKSSAVQKEKRQSNMGGTPQPSKKARQTSEVEGFMANMSTNLSQLTPILSKTADAIGNLLSEGESEKAKQKVEEDLLNTQRKDLFSTMDRIEGLTRIQAIATSRRLIRDDRQLQLFFDFENDCDRLAFVLDLLGE